MTGGSYGVRKVSKNDNNGETTKEETTKTCVYTNGRIILKLVPESMASSQNRNCVVHPARRVNLLAPEFYM